VPRLPVPPLLSDLAGWGWRALLLAVIAYLVFTVVLRLALVSVPVAAALLLAGLLAPAVAAQRRWGLPRWLATLLTVVGSLSALGGALFWVVDRAVAQAPILVDRVQQAVANLPISNNVLQQAREQVVSYLQIQGGSLTGRIVTGVQTVGEALTGIVLTVLLTIILLADGDRMWGWIVGRLPERGQPRLYAAGRAAWSRLSGWIRGTVLIAAFHGVVVGLTLLLLGAPLVAPLAVLIFLGSFIPLFGSLLFGGLAVLVTFADQGLASAVVLLGVLVVANQFEAHVLQPFLVGRYVRLHPFVVAVVITAGIIVAGLPGALLAVPFTAAAYAALVEVGQPVAPRVRRVWGRRISARASGAGEES
jgi:predicted PurR-regulated permease PerM